MAVSKLNKIKMMIRCKLLKVNVKFTKYSYGLNTDKKGDKKIILSLTSYNKRFSTIHLCLKSLLNQTIKPDMIIVWLYEQEESMLTKEMLELQKYGIEYKFVENDLKPHKKYFYALKEFCDDIVITVDDDCIYPKNLVESLYKYHIKYPNSICARRVHKAKFKNNNELSPYNEWSYEYTETDIPSYSLIATGVGGVLYPPHCLPPETFSISNIENLCLDADDIWLKIMEVKNGKKVVWAKNDFVHPAIINGTQETGLNTFNVNEQKNDVFLERVCNYYHLDKNNLFRDKE